MKGLDLVQKQHLRDLGFFKWSVCNIVTTDDILETLPRFVIEPRNILRISRRNGFWVVKYSPVPNDPPVIVEMAETLLEASFQMLCWCIKHAYVHNEPKGGEK